jgi:hypothetical protein
MNLNNDPKTPKLEPGDLTVINYNKQGQKWCFDASLVDTMASGNSKVDILTLLATRVKDKIKKYDDTCRAHNIVFRPIVLTQLGRLHPASYAVLRDLLGVEDAAPRDAPASIARQLADDVPVSAEQLRRRTLLRELQTEIAGTANQYHAMSVIYHASLGTAPMATTVPDATANETTRTVPIDDPSSTTPTPEETAVADVAAGEATRTASDGGPSSTTTS